jgi:hypothetical protein
MPKENTLDIYERLSVAANLDELKQKEVTGAPQKHVHKKTKPYIRIPVDWYYAAYKLGSAHAALGAALWHKQNLAKRLTFRYSFQTMSKKTGLHRNVLRLRLCQLEAAGLLKVKSKSGRMPIVTLIEETPLAPAGIQEYAVGIGLQPAAD